MRIDPPSHPVPIHQTLKPTPCHAPDRATTATTTIIPHTMEQGLNPDQNPPQLAVPMPRGAHQPQVIRPGRKPSRAWIRTPRLPRPHLHGEEVRTEGCLRGVRVVHAGHGKQATDVAEQVDGRVPAGQGEPLGNLHKEREELRGIALNVGAGVRELVALGDGELHVGDDAHQWFGAWIMRLEPFSLWAG